MQLPDNYRVGVIFLLVLIVLIYCFFIRKFLLGFLLKKQFYCSTTNISVRIFYFSIGLSSLIATNSFCAHTLLSFGPIDMSFWVKNSILFVCVMFSPVVSFIIAWAATISLLFFWEQMDKDLSEVPPMFKTEEDKKLFVDEREERNADKGKKRELSLKKLHDIATDVRSLKDQNTGSDARFTLKYVDVVKSLETLHEEPMLPQQISPSRGFHLCLSTDSGLIKLNQPHSFLFQATQYRWAKRYPDFCPTEEGPVYLFSETQHQEQYNVLDWVIRSSVTRCFDSVQSLQIKLDFEQHGVDVPTDRSSYCSEFVYPRAIRLIVSPIEDLVEVLYDHYTKDFDGWILSGPSSRVLNLWIPSEIRNKMDVTAWRCGEEVSDEFYVGLFNEEGKSLAVKSPPEILKNYNEVLEDFLEMWKADKSLHSGNGNNRILDTDFIRASEMFTNCAISAGGFLSVGGVCTMVGSRGEYNPPEANDSPWQKRAFFEVLPIVLMALHCKKMLFFDWIYKVVILDLKKEMRGSKKRIIRKRLDRFLS